MRCRRQDLLSDAPVGDAAECVEVLLVCVGKRVEVLLGCLDLRVAHPLHDAVEVSAASKEPGGVGVAEIVHADVEVDP
jgi:hypothetical protein